MQPTILLQLENTARRFPGKLAFADLREEFTFSRLLDCARRIGSYVAAALPARTPVVVYMEKRAYNVAAFLGAVYAGCFYVPLDSRMPAGRIATILQTLRPGLVLYDDATEPNVGLFGEEVQKVHYRTAMAAAVDGERLAAVRRQAKNTDLLYVLFTSGSTGTPKGVTISHAAVQDFADWVCEKYALDETAVLCNQAPFYFDASVPDLYIPLWTGATVYIPPRIYYTFPKKVLQFIIEKGVNTLVWVPSALCNVVNCRAFAVAVPTTVRLVIFCGEVMPCKHLRVWRQYLPDALYVNMYGPTEATYACMYYDIDRDFADDEKLPLGQACGNSTVLLLNERDEPAAEGEPGEICVLGQCLSNGYYAAPDKTAAAFVQNPLNAAWREPMYRTGDLAYRQNGEIRFAGRKDFQIKRLGHRIELGEIENALIAVPGVENACCVFDAQHGDIIAVYTGTTESEALAGAAAARLPSYMLPRDYVHLKAMPMNLNGKIDRTGLQQEYAGGK